MAMKFGIHMPQKGGFAKNVERAARIGCRSVQIFAGNPTSWKSPLLNPEELKKRSEVLQENGISPLLVHAPYLVNLSAVKEEFYHKSRQLLRETVERAAYMEAPFVVLHMGSHRGMGFDEGLELFASTLKTESRHWPEKVQILLENTAGGGNSLGGSFASIGYVLKSLKNDLLLGVCLDTAHAWAAGYDFSTSEGFKELIEEIDLHIGLENIKALHVNDTGTPCGSHRDRHAHLGEGMIGEEGFTAFLRYPWPEDLPAILETPENGTDWDIVNLEKLRFYAGANGESLPNSREN
ncbi:MAG: deoxyribonuclease IV [Firmicutes bacterium]|nr:deoxyribonuclease IV [Bacillota bacterium]